MDTTTPTQPTQQPQVDQQTNDPTSFVVSPVPMSPAPAPVQVSQQSDSQHSYADAYQPPTTAIFTPDSQVSTEQPTEQPTEQQPQEQLPDQSVGASSFSAPSDDQRSLQQPNEVVPQTTQTNPSEELADQNIFEMLGVTTGTSEQREQFLDELQQVIWEDFIENDTKLLLTDSEQAELATMMQSSVDKSLEQQEQVVIFLEKIIPDLEEIMLEKALQLKEEMARERVKALRELHKDDPAKIGVIEQVEQLISQEKWLSASKALISI